jgi:hypothetical protein
MLFRETNSFCWENRKKNINTLCGQKANFYYVKEQMVHVVTTGRCLASHCLAMGISITIQYSNNLALKGLKMNEDSKRTYQVSNKKYNYDEAFE